MQSIVLWEAWQQEWETPHTVFAISKQSQANDGPQLAVSTFLVSPGPQHTRYCHVNPSGNVLPGTPQRCAESMSWTFLNPSSWRWRLTIAWDKLPTQRQTLEPLITIDLMTICPSFQLFEFTYLMVLSKNFRTHILLPPYFHHHHISSPQDCLPRKGSTPQLHQPSSPFQSSYPLKQNAISES